MTAENPTRTCPITTFREGNKQTPYIYPRDCKGWAFEGKIYPPCLFWSGQDCFVRTFFFVNASPHISD